MYGDPDFAPLLLLVPERHYADADKTIRVYFDMHTGRWWWATQVTLLSASAMHSDLNPCSQKEIEKTNPGATIVPLIISSDKTQLTLFGNKAAYPVYLTIGNLPKDIRCKPSRRGQILLAYLPTSSLGHIKNKSARRRALSNLFHACMKRILSPVKEVGKTGILLASGDGLVRRCHPLLAVYVGDYPEQLLVTCRKTGDCPKCPTLLNEIGDTTLPPSLHDLDAVYATLDMRDEGPAAFTRACQDARMRPITEPFWEDLPYVNIFAAITPDILHQLHQGIVKHLVTWLKTVYGADEIDARCRRFPPNHHIRLFMKGITKLTRLTGKEHADICRFLLGLIIGLPLPGGRSPARLIQAVRAILDFVYMAQYAVHTTETLDFLNDALERFHSNKEIFVELGVRDHFNIPKLHALLHYTLSIQLFGTTDNYDTQYSERLHIDLAKNAYRNTNHKNEYSQMTTWLLRKEKIERHSIFMQWYTAQLDSDGLAHAQPLGPRGPLVLAHQDPELHVPRGPEHIDIPIQEPLSHELPQHRMTSVISMSKYPSVKALTFEAAARDYGATHLRPALARFVARFCDPEIASACQLEQAASGVFFRFQRIPVWHKIKFKLWNQLGFGIGEESDDVVHAKPRRSGTGGTHQTGRFDTALIRDGDVLRGGLDGTL